MPKLNRRVAGSRAYKNWTNEQLEKCLADIRAGIISQRQAEVVYKIPRSTLKNKLKGMFEKKPGRQTVLSTNEEESIVEHIKVLSEFGFPVTELDLRHVVKLYLDRRGRTTVFKDNLPGYDWVKLFLGRYKDLSTRMSTNIKMIRAAVNEEVISAYFENLEKSLEGVSASNCWNYDETNLTDDPGNSKVICRRGSKYVENIMNTTKTSTSLMLCGNAEGEMLPPYVVYKAEKMWDLWTEGGPKGCRYNRSKSGWFDSTIFEDWFFSLLLPKLRKTVGPKILIGDNLASHLSEKVISACNENEIRFVCLPPNSTHLTQPLDVAYFHPLKSEWRKILREWKKTPDGERCTTLSKDRFPALLKKLIDVALADKGENLKAGFRKCGIFPINKQQVLDRLPSTKEIDPNLVGEAFLDAVKIRREEITQASEQKRIRRKKVNVEAGKSICPDDFKIAEAGGSVEKKPSKRGRPRKTPIEDLDSSDSDSISVHDDPFEDVTWSENDDNDEAPVDEDAMFTDAPREFKVGDFVAVNYNETLYPALVVSIDEAPEDGKLPILLDCMAKGQKSWRWPEKKDLLPCQSSDIDRKIKPPKMLRRGYFSVPELEIFS